MTSRQKGIWDLLLEGTCLSAGQLGRMLHISDRTVRSDIKEINRELNYEAIKAVKGKGFVIEEDGWKQFRREETPDSGDDQWEIVRRVLFDEERDYLVMAEELYISDGLLSKRLEQINRTMVLRYGKEMIRKKNGWLELGLDEAQKRDYYSIYVTGCRLGHYFEVKEYQPYFLWADLEKISSIILKKLKGWKLYDTTLMRLIISTAVLAERVQAGFVIREYDEKETVEEEIRRILDEVAEASQVLLPEGEYHYFKRLLKNDFYQVDQGNEQEIEAVLKKILIEISVEYGFDFTENKEFIEEMKAQINGTVQRAKNEQYAVNPVLPQIKSKYPLEYDIAIFFTDRLGKLKGIKVSEDEIAQFAVHLIWAMESSFGRTRQKIALINPYGKQYKDLIEKRIGAIGDCKIEIAYQYSIFDYPQTMPPDAIAVMATAPLPRPIEDTPVVLCRNFLDYHELERLLTVIRENQVISVRHYFRTLFKPSLFFTDMEFNSKEQTLEFMCGRLEEEGYVDRGFYDSVMRRESIAPTAFEQGFVFAHGMENDARRTAVCTCILKNRIPWGEYQVKIVFLFALASSWNHTMIPIYNVMIDNLFEKSTIYKLSKIRECRKFVDLLI